MAPTKTSKKNAKTAGASQQDVAEAVNLAAQEIKEEVDTVTTTTPTTTEPETQAKPKKTRAKKAAPSPEPTPEVKEESTAPETPSAHPLKDTTEEEKAPKAKKPRAKKEPKEAKPKEEKAPKEPKEKKRAPSAYNLFVKEIMPELKKANADNGKTQRDLMKLAAERWNEHKAKNAAAAQ
jgi:hypothetical protein